MESRIPRGYHLKVESCVLEISWISRKHEAVSGVVAFSTCPVFRLPPPGNHIHVFCILVFTLYFAILLLSVIYKNIIMIIQQ